VPDPLDTYLDSDREGSVQALGPVDIGGSRAKLFVSQVPPSPPPWADFLRKTFADIDTPAASSTAALLVMEVEHRGTPAYMAFAFGLGGRHLLRSGCWERGYGLRTALNLIYPGEGADADLGRLTTVEHKTRSRYPMRARRQASRATNFDEFGVDHFRDVLGLASGRPADREAWGTRVSGGDAVYVFLPVDLDGLPGLCRRLLEAHARSDYKTHFDWLDDLQPVNDRDRTAALEQRIVNDLFEGNTDHLELAAPEVLDPTRCRGFIFPDDVRAKIVHPDLRLGDLLRSIASHGGTERITAQFLKSRRITAVNGDGRAEYKWPVWRCLVGEYATDAGTVILDEGEFIDVSARYLDALNAFVDHIEEPAIKLPAAGRAMVEADYNAKVIQEVPGCVLLDRRTFTIPGRASAIEICDVLTLDHEFVHVKRHLGSSDLSHLFAQGQVSAEVMQDEPAARKAIRAAIRIASSNDASFDFVPAADIRPSDYTVVFGVIAAWRGRTLSQALPFFSKVNLRGHVIALRQRGFSVAFAQIGAA